jgi:hypothetical protein
MQVHYLYMWNNILYLFVMQLLICFAKYILKTIFNEINNFLFRITYELVI